MPPSTSRRPACRRAPARWRSARWSTVRASAGRGCGRTSCRSRRESSRSPPTSTLTSLQFPQHRRRYPWRRDPLCRRSRGACRAAFRADIDCPCIDESAEAAAPQHVRRDFDRKPLHNAAEIDLHLRPGEAHRLSGFVEQQIAIVDERAYAGELGGGRKMWLLVIEPPESHERTNGDVEGSVRGLAYAARGFEDTEHRFAYCDWRVRSGLVDERQLAIIAV